MSATRILVVEDDNSLAEILAYNLRDAGYEVDIAGDGREALAKANSIPPTLVVLDLMMPTMDGLEVCRRLRYAPATRDVLIIMLTAKSEESDQVVGFAVGADDYVTKPFSVKVLLQRIKALLRRRDSAEDRDVVANEGIIVDRRRHVAAAGENPLDLTPSEFGILDTLIRQPGRAFSRSDLIDSALGSETIVLERTIDVHIRSLRQKLGEFAALVETVRGVGYRFRDSRSFGQ